MRAEKEPQRTLPLYTEPENGLITKLFGIPGRPAAPNLSLTTIEERHAIIDETLAEMRANKRFHSCVEALSLRFGLTGGVGKTWGEVGEAIGKTSDRAFQLGNRALYRLRHPAYGQKLRPFMFFNPDSVAASIFDIWCTRDFYSTAKVSPEFADTCENSDLFDLNLSPEAFIDLIRLAPSYSRRPANLAEIFSAVIVSHLQPKTVEELSKLSL